MHCHKGLSVALSLFLVTALLLPQVARATAPSRTLAEPPSLPSSGLRAPPTLPLGEPSAAGDERSLASPARAPANLPPVAGPPNPQASLPTGPWLGRLLFAPAVDADGDPASNPGRGQPVPVLDLGGDIIGMVVLAAQLGPDDAGATLIGEPLTFRVWTADGFELQRTVRSDAWGSASVEFPLPDPEAEYQYQASAPGYSGTEVRRFRLDPAQARWTMEMGGVELLHEQLGDGVVRFSLRSGVALEPGQDEAHLYVVRYANGPEVWPGAEPDQAEGRDLEGGDDAMPLPLVEMEVTGAHTAVAEVVLPQGLYGIAASITDNGEQTHQLYSPRIELDVAHVEKPVAPSCIWASPVEHEPGQTLIRLRDQGKWIVYDLVPTARVPDADPFEAGPVEMIKRWRTGAFEWREERYDIEVETLVDDGKKTISLQGFDYDPMLRRYTLAIRSLLGEAVTDTLRIDVLGPNGVILMHQDRPVVLVPGQTFLYEIEVPTELGQPHGLRISLDDPIMQMINTIRSLSTKLLDKLGDSLSFELKYYAIVLGYKFAEVKCSGEQCKFSTPDLDVKEAIKNVFKDMYGAGDLVIGSLGMDFSLDFTTLFPAKEGPCPIPDSADEVRDRIKHLALDINNMLDAMKPKIKPIETPKLPLFWFLMFWAEIVPFVRGTASQQDLALKFGAQAGLSMQGKVGVGLSWGKSLSGFWGMLTLMSTLYEMVMLAEEIEKLQVDDACKPPDAHPPDDRQDVWQSFGDMYQGQSHEETIGNLVDLVERARARDLWRAERLFVLELREAELARFTDDRAAMAEYVEQADVVLDAMNNDLEDLLDGTTLIAPGETITEAWSALVEESIVTLDNLDYALRQQQLMDAVEVAQRGYDELYGQELALHHELRELFMSDTIGVLAAGFADATMAALTSTGLRYQLISPWASGGNFKGKYAPYVPPQSAPKALIVPAGAMRTVSTSPETRAWLEEYAASGGLLIVFTQATGEDWASLPGGEVAGAGYLEDQRCQHASVEAAAYSNWLVWMGVEQPDIQVDGAFTAWPQDATVLLRRTRGAYAGFPAMIEYAFGQGTVLATSAYGDWAFRTASLWGDDWQLTRTVLLRAWLLTQGQDVEDVPVADAGNVVGVSFPLTNTATYTITEVRVAVPVEITWWYGFRFETTVPQTIAPGESEVIVADVPTPSTRRGVHNWTRVGLYRTRLAAQGDPRRRVYRPWGPIVYVRSTVARPDLTVDLHAERGRANLFETLRVTATVRSALSSPADVVLTPQGDLTGVALTRTVPAQGQVQEVYSLRMDASKIPGLRLDAAGGGGYLDRATTAIRLDYPRLAADLDLPPVLTGGSGLTLTVENQGLGTLPVGTVALTLTSPLNAIVWTADQVLPALAAGEAISMPYLPSWPSDPDLGSYSLSYRVDDWKGLVKTSRVPLPTLGWHSDLDQQSYRVREQLAFTTTVQNVGRFDLAPVVTVSVPAVGFQAVRSPSLPVGASTSLPFSLTLPHTLTAGAYAVVLQASQATTVSDTTVFVVAPSEIEASLAGVSYQAGETLTVTLNNSGGADTVVDYDLRLAGYGSFVAHPTGTLAIQAGASGRVTASIPAGAAGGPNYALRLLADDQAAGRRGSWTWPLEVEGVAATVAAWTLESEYTAGDTVTATGEVSVTAGSLVSAPLSLAVYGAQGTLYDAVPSGMGPYYNRTYPAIAADGAGNAYAVWSDDRANGDIYFASRTATQTWTANLDVDAATGAPARSTTPDIAVDAAGNAHVVWVDYRNGDGDIYYAQRSAAGVWSQSERVNLGEDANDSDSDPAIAADAAGNAYVLWRNYSYAASRYVIYFAHRPATGGWSGKQRVDSSSDSTKDAPAIGVDATGNAFALWMDNRNGSMRDIYFAYRPVTGTWQTSVKVNDDVGTTQRRYPAITVDASGHAYAAWQDGRLGTSDIFFAGRPVTGTWSANEQVDADGGNIGKQSWPSIVVDAQGSVHATWRDGRWWSDIGDIFYARRLPAGGWNPSFPVNTDTDTTGTHRQDYPDLAIDGKGCWHFVWSDGRLATDGGRKDIFARKRFADYSWEADIKVNDDDSVPQDQWEPEVAVTAEGDAFAVWDDYRDGNWDIYFAHRPITGTWAAAEKVNDDVGEAWQEVPKIAVDPEGNASAVWEDRRNGSDDLYFAYRPYSGTWGANVKLNVNPADDAEYASVAMDPDGNTYVIWEQERLSDSPDIFFAYRAADGTWSANEQVNDDDGGSVWQDDPDIDVDADGNAYAVWVDEDAEWNRSIFYAYRPSGGAWGTDVEISDDSGGAWPEYPAVAVDAVGNAYSVWLDFRESNWWHVYGAHRPAGGSWSSNERVDDDPVGYDKVDDGIGLDSDDKGNLFASWDDSRWRVDPGDSPRDISLSYRASGDAWSPQVMVNVERAIAYWADVASDEYGNAHVVWSATSDNDRGVTHYAIVQAPFAYWTRTLTVTTGTGWPFTETVGALNSRLGKYWLAATLKNDLGQTLARDSEPFYIHPLSLTLTLETDREAYLPGQTASISGWLTNTGAISKTLTLEVRAAESSLYSRTIELASGEGISYSTSTVINQDLILVASAGAARVYEDVVVAEPEVAAALEAPNTVGRDPFTATVVLTNTGLVSAAVEADFGGQAMRATTLEAGQMSMLQASLSYTESTDLQVILSGDVALTLTQAITQGEAASLALLTGGTNVRAGPVSVPYTISNPGVLPARVEVSATLHSEALYTFAQSLLILAGQVYSGSLVFEVPPGEHQLTLILFGAYGGEMGRQVYDLWAVEDEAPEGPDASLTAVTPWPQPAAAGQTLSVTLSVRNQGAGGPAVAGLQAFDVEHQSALTLTGQLSETVVLTLAIPTDAPSGDYIGQASLDGQSQPFTLTVDGIDVGLDIALGQTSYLSGEVASLVVTLTEQAGLSNDHILSLRYLDAEDYVTVTVPAHGVVQHTFYFTATAPGRASVSLAYVPSAAGQRIIMIDSLPVQVSDPARGVSLTSDKAIYDAGETVQLNLNIGSGLGSVTLMGPMELMWRDGDFLMWQAPYDTDGMQATPGSYPFSVQLPADLNSGQYSWQLRVDGESQQFSVDVRGWQVTSQGVSLDRVRYARQDSLTAVAQFFNEGDTVLTGLTLSAWLAPPGGEQGLQLLPAVNQAVELQPGLNVFTVTGSFDTPHSGTHRLVLSLLPACECYRLAGASTHFDVGWAHLVELVSDQGTYEVGEPGEGSLEVYGYGLTSLVVTATNGATLLNIQPDLAGYGTYTFGIPTATTGDYVLVARSADLNGNTDGLLRAYAVPEPRDCQSPEVYLTYPVTTTVIATAAPTVTITVEGVVTDDGGAVADGGDATTVDEGGEVTVIVQGQVVTPLQDGTFSLDIKVVQGLNLISATAIDAAGNVSFTSIIPLYLVPNHGLAFSVDRPVAGLGQSVTYQAVLTASGALSDVALYQGLPTSMISDVIVSASSGQISVGDLDPERHSVNWHGDIGAGEQVIVTVQAALQATGTLTQTATAFWGWGTLEESGPVRVEIQEVADCTPVSGTGFVFSPAGPLVGQTVVLTGSVTTGTPAITWQWSFGDGETGSGQVVTHDYPVALGEQAYTVVLTAANSCPSQEVVRHDIVVGPWEVFLPVVLRDQ